MQLVFQKYIQLIVLIHNEIFLFLFNTPHFDFFEVQ